MKFYVYIIELNNGAYYTGYTTDLEKRFESHKKKAGAKITRSFKPLRMVSAWQVNDKSTALKLEARIKQLSRTNKEILLKQRSVGRQFHLIGVRRVAVPAALI